ncbi:GTPase-activating protein skywalker-like isoform X2 [Diadema setosum]|uniref:GTPase-activating protein skywalker-like isoform X2 n=1 Tax=Diadema setosum TaxID=31175 RepID=UPI003B3A4FEC
MPSPTDETGDASVANGGMEPSTDVKTVGEDSHSAGDAESATNGGHVHRENGPDTSESSPKVNIDVPTVSAAMHIKKTDNTATDGQAGSKVEEGDDKVGDLSSHVQRREKGGGGDVSSDKRKSLMLWVDPQLVQTVRVEQGVSKSPQHSPENIPNDMKRLKKVVRKERWAAETEHEVRKDVWKKLCLQNSAGASVANIYSEVEEGLFGPDKAAAGQSSTTLPSFVDPDHPTACYALLSEGQMRLNRLLCVFADTRPDILYCPLLAPVASMLLHYMSPEDTFDCLSALLGSTRYKFLEISWVGYESFRMSFEKLASRFASSAHKFVARQGDVAEIYKDWVWWILEDLPFSHLIRVMDCYLSEGLKIFYRVGLAILKLYKKHKGSSPAQEDIVTSIHQFVKSIPESPNALLAEGFQFRGLSRSVIGAYQTKHKQQLREDNSPSRRNTQRQNDALSKLTPIKSSVISHQQLHTLWGWIPSRFSVYQPSLVFTTQEHGFSLTTFYTRCEYCEPTILLIKTSDQEIFGAYLSASWSTRNDEDHKGIYFGTGESFLFSLAPEEKKYPWVGINAPGKEDKEEEEGDVEEGKEDMKRRMSEMFMRATPTLIAVGGGDGDGILIEGDLTKGFSGRCLTFNNPPLASERSYSCAVIEVITMEDGRNPTENNA